MTLSFKSEQIKLDLKKKSVVVEGERAESQMLADRKHAENCNCTLSFKLD